MSEDKYNFPAGRHVGWPLMGMFAAVSIWGVTYVIVKEAVSSWPVFSFLALRFWVATLALYPLSILELRKQRKCRGAVTINKRLGFYAGLVLFGAYALQTTGLTITSASSAAFLTSLYLVFVPMLLFLAGRSTAPKLEWLAALLALIGIYCITRTDQSGTSHGNILIVLCAGCYAVQILLVSANRQEKLPILFTTVQLLVVAMASTLLAFFETPLSLAGLPTLTADVLAAAVFTGLISTAFCYLTQTWSQKHLTATQTAVLLSLEPVFAASSGYLILNEAISSGFILGGLLIFLAVALSQFSTQGLA